MAINATSHFSQVLTAIAANMPLPGESEPIASADLSSQFALEDPRFIFDRVSIALETNHSLIALDLSGNYTSPSNSEVMKKIFMSHTHLASLNLSENVLDTNAIVALAEGLKVNTSLTALELKDPWIEAVALEALQSALADNHTLRHLKLSSFQEFADAVVARGAVSPSTESSGSEIKRIAQALVGIQQRVVENENSFEKISLAAEERAFRDQVCSVYETMEASVKAKVEYQVWQNFGCPKGDPRFGKNNTFTSWSVFTASVRSADVDMIQALEHHYSGSEMLDFLKWAKATFS